jgi:hypothetical protein
MTLGVIEPKTSAIICPALEVTSGQKTFQAANREYKGLTLPCLHCWEELRRNGTRWLERGLVEAIEEEASQQNPMEYKIPQNNTEIWANYRNEDAGIIRNLVAKGFKSALGNNLPIEYDIATEKVVRTAVDATFRKGSFDTSTGKRRWMHFTHSTGRLKGTAQFSCHDPAGIDHQVAVGSFQLMLRDHYKTWADIVIIPEKTIVCKPGEPPETRRPDLSVYQGKDEVIRVLEIQRSPISLSSLRARTESLRNICQRVEWYFSRGVYIKASMHEQRKWLTEENIDYFYYWYDEKSGKLVYLPGKPTESRFSAKNERSVYQQTSGKMVECRHFDNVEDIDNSWRKATEALTVSMLGAAVHLREDNAGDDDSAEHPIDLAIDQEFLLQVKALGREVSIILAHSEISWNAFLEIGSKYSKDVKQYFWDSLDDEQKIRIQGYRDMTN